MGRKSKTMYVITLNIRGLKDTYTTQSLSRARNKINDLLESISLTYNSKKLLTEGTIQRKFREHKRDRLSMEIENIQILIQKVEHL